VFLHAVVVLTAGYITGVPAEAKVSAAAITILWLMSFLFRVFPMFMTSLLLLAPLLLLASLV
jgi:hypothetical protein